jgi:hypothetical protein
LAVLHLVDELEGPFHAQLSGWIKLNAPPGFFHKLFGPASKTGTGQQIPWIEFTGQNLVEKILLTRIMFHRQSRQLLLRLEGEQAVLKGAGTVSQLEFNAFQSREDATFCPDLVFLRIDRTTVSDMVTEFLIDNAHRGADLIQLGGSKGIGVRPNC